MHRKDAAQRCAYSGRPVTPRPDFTRRHARAWVLALLALLAQLAGLQFAAAHQARMLAQGGLGAQVCTAAGQLVTVAGAALPGDPAGDAQNDAEQPCTTCAVVAIAPPSSATGLPPRHGLTARREARDSTPRRVAARTRPPARAPPSLA